MHPKGEKWSNKGVGRALDQGVFYLYARHLMQNLGFRVTKCGLQHVTVVTRVVEVISWVRWRLRWGKWKLVNIFIFKAWQLLRWSLTLIPLCWTWHPVHCQKAWRVHPHIPFFVQPYIHSSTHPSTSIHLIYAPIHPCIHLYIHPSIYLPIHLLIYPSIY